MFIIVYKFTQDDKCPHCKKKVIVSIKPAAIFYDGNFNVIPGYENVLVNSQITIEKVKK